jgi:hypothetical protein
MNRRGRQCRVREIEAFPTQSSAVPHPRALRMPTKRPAQKNFGSRECDARRRHSPLPFISNGDVGTPVSKGSFKREYRPPKGPSYWLIVAQNSGQNQRLTFRVKSRQRPVYLHERSVGGQKTGTSAGGQPRASAQARTLVHL